jgi:hypothetical protein
VIGININVEIISISNRKKARKTSISGLIGMYYRRCMRFAHARHPHERNNISLRFAGSQEYYVSVCALYSGLRSGVRSMRRNTDPKDHYKRSCRASPCGTHDALANGLPLRVAPYCREVVRRRQRRLARSWRSLQRPARQSRPVRAKRRPEPRGAFSLLPHVAVAGI